MDSIDWKNLVLNKFLFMSLFLYMYILRYYIEPFKSGYYCDDLSINVKYHDSTIDDLGLFTYSLGMPLILIIVTELANRTNLKSSTKRKHFYNIKLFNSKIIEVKDYYGNIYINVGVYLIGVLLVTIITYTGKVTVGRLRPNFLDVCKPDINPYGEICNFKKSGKTYIVPEVDFNCKSTDKENIEESRLSFPSGHASFVFYSSVFLILFLNRYWNRSCVLCLHVFQLFLATAAFIISLTRITDNKHHPTDVLAGACIGTFVGAMNFLYWSRLVNKRITNPIVRHQLPLYKNDSNEFLNSSNSNENYRLLDQKII